MCVGYVQTLSFYIKDLSTHGFWYLGAPRTNPQQIVKVDCIYGDLFLAPLFCSIDLFVSYFANTMLSCYMVVYSKP